MTAVKFFLMIVLGMFTAFSANADCGLSGPLEERIASCAQTKEGLQLVMQKNGSSYWFSAKTKSVFNLTSTIPREAAKRGCQSYVAELKLVNVKYEWGLASSAELTLGLTKVYPQLAITNNNFDEKKYWLNDIYDHPSGQPWSAFYSTKGGVGFWFADAGDLIYVGGICSVMLN